MQADENCIETCQGPPAFPCLQPNNIANAQTIVFPPGGSTMPSSSRKRCRAQRCHLQQVPANPKTALPVQSDQPAQAQTHVSRQASARVSEEGAQKARCIQSVASRQFKHPLLYRDIYLVQIAVARCGSYPPPQAPVQPRGSTSVAPIGSPAALLKTEASNPADDSELKQAQPPFTTGRKHDKERHQVGHQQHRQEALQAGA